MQTLPWKFFIHIYMKPEDDEYCDCQLVYFLIETIIAIDLSA